MTFDEALALLNKKIKPWEEQSPSVSAWEEKVQDMRKARARIRAREQFALRQNSSLLPTWSKEDWVWSKGIYG